MGFFSITTSGFLAAYALLLGCNNFQIGILAAIPFLTQPIQILAIPLVERIRRRKVIVLASRIPAQLAWLPIALIPPVPGYTEQQCCSDAAGHHGNSWCVCLFHQLCLE